MNGWPNGRRDTNQAVKTKLKWYTHAFWYVWLIILDKQNLLYENKRMMDTKQQEISNSFFF